MSSKTDVKPIVIVQGGQWGSEAKGLITAKIVHDRKADICVRTGTVNAGHTVYYKGRAYKMQQLPVGWVRPQCVLALGAGAYIHPGILQREIEMVSEATGEDVRDRLLIDHNCGLHLDAHTDRSTISGRHHSMGATGKGCSEAVVDKIRGRGRPGLLTFKEWAMANCDDPLHQLHCFTGNGFSNTAFWINHSFDQGKQIVIEGTQGTLLDLHLGPYPYTTHKQTQASNWLAECGLSPTLPLDLVLVMRTFPIRVAGNSGPMPREIGWDRLAFEMNDRLLKLGLRHRVSPVAISNWQDAVSQALEDEGDCPQTDPCHWTPGQRKEYAAVASEVYGHAWASLTGDDQEALSLLFERTTVTNKLRRIARWDPETTETAIMLNRPTSVALTFLNYVFPELWGLRRGMFRHLASETKLEVVRYIKDREKEMGCKVSMVGFGPTEEETLDRHEVFSIYTEVAG